MSERGTLRKRRKPSEFKLRERAIARSLEGTTGPVKYAGKDRRYSPNEAKESAGAITASIGRKKFGPKRFAEMSAEGRKRAARQ